jgi:hypothetical protein
MPLPRSWAEARCHEAVRSIFSDETGHWVELNDSYVCEESECENLVRANSFRDLRRMLSVTRREGANERRTSALTW